VVYYKRKKRRLTAAAALDSKVAADEPAKEGYHPLPPPTTGSRDYVDHSSNPSSIIGAHG
jgi:hypothetical protein